jgi:hypothetical protein
MKFQQIALPTVSRAMMLVCIGYAGGFLLPADSSGSYYVSEPFDYPEGVGIDFLEGGEGWTSEWVAKSDGFLIPKTALVGDDMVMRLEGTNEEGTTVGMNEVVFRSFPEFNEGSLYIGLTISYSGGTPGFFSMWFDNSAGVDYNHTAGRFNLGILNSSGTLFARVAVSGAGNVIASDVIAEPDTVYKLVGRLSKAIPGEGNRFNKIDFWINPTGDDLESPLASTETEQPLTLGLPHVSVLGVRVSSMWAGTIYNVHDIVLSTDWNDMPFSEASGPDSWGGYVIGGDNRVDTGNFLGWISLVDAPWVYLEESQRWLYVEQEWVSGAGTFAFDPGLPRGDAAAGPQSFHGYPVTDGWISTPRGHYYVDHAPIVYSDGLGRWIGLFEAVSPQSGAWVYAFDANP